MYAMKLFQHSGAQCSQHLRSACEAEGKSEPTYRSNRGGVEGSSVKCCTRGGRKKVLSLYCFHG
jgi:hypothetical protein